MPTRGELQDRICNMMVKFQKEQFGRGAESAKTYIIDDMIIVRMKGVLTPAEKQLAQNQDGQRVIKEFRYHLEEVCRPQLEQLVSSVIDAQVISLHCDISTKTGERIDIFIMDRDLENKRE